MSKEDDKKAALEEAERVRKETLAKAKEEDRRARAEQRRQDSERVERARREWEGK